MKAHIKELKSQQGKSAVTIIWVSASPSNPMEMAEARTRLNNYINRYVGNEGHNVYLHSEGDTVAAVITFDINSLPGEDIDI